MLPIILHVTARVGQLPSPTIPTSIPHAGHLIMHLLETEKITQLRFFAPRPKLPVGPQEGEGLIAGGCERRVPYPGGTLMCHHPMRGGGVMLGASRDATKE